MHDPGIRTRLALQQQIRIGRLAIDLAVLETRLICSRERVAGVGDAAYMLIVPLRGAFQFSQSGRTGSVGPGEYLMISQMDFYEMASEEGPLLLMLRIPAAELRGRLASVDDHVARRFSSNARMTKLLVDLLEGVVGIFGDGAPPNPEALATEIVSFVALAIAAEDRGAVLDVRNTRYRLRRRIFDYIESNLGDQSLSPKKIAASSRISLSYLYSLFSDDDTTVGQFLQTKRLQRAYEILVADPAGRLTVAEVAYQVGFKNVSHFSRTFSRHFRVAPRDARRSTRTFSGAAARPWPSAAQPAGFAFGTQARADARDGTPYRMM